MRDELGSEWHACTLDRESWPWDEHRLYATGRDALVALVRQLSPPRVWVPSYSCHPFYRAIERLTSLHVYEDLPTWKPELPDDDEAMVVVHNPFGLRGQVPRGRARWWVEDHTHAPASPWAHDSVADYAIASLRKTLPMPDGAVLWSPRGLDLPDAPAPKTTPAARMKLDGMVLKARYLNGENIEKAGFRAMLAQGEAELGGSIAVESVEVLQRGGPARAVRARNQAILGGYGVPSADPAPSFLFLVFDASDERNRVRTALIAAGVYPSALWPLELPVSSYARALSRRSFAIPIDGRMTEATAYRIAALLRANGVAGRAMGRIEPRRVLDLDEVRFHVSGGSGWGLKTSTSYGEDNPIIATRQGLRVGDRFETWERIERFDLEDRVETSVVGDRSGQVYVGLVMATGAFGAWAIVRRPVALTPSTPPSTKRKLTDSRELAGLLAALDRLRTEALAGADAGGHQDVPRALAEMRSRGDDQGES